MSFKIVINACVDLSEANRRDANRSHARTLAMSCLVATVKYVGNVNACNFHIAIIENWSRELQVVTQFA